MTSVANRLRPHVLAVKIVLYLRGLLSENKIPDELFGILKSYYNELSANVPDIDAINKALEADVMSLNGKPDYHENRRTVKDKAWRRLPGLINEKKNRSIRYDRVRILQYQEILEANAVRDRVFTIDMNMMPGSGSSFADLLKEKADSFGWSYYYSVKLSSLL